MRRCEFPSASTTLDKMNEHSDMKIENKVYSFTLNGILFKSSETSENSKVRITLKRKVNGEKIYFYDDAVLKFYPDIEKLKPKEIISNIGDSRTDLIRTFGSAKAQKQLREKEKLNINKEATKTLKDINRDAFKNEKANKLSMDCSIDGINTSMLSLIDSNNCIKFSSIAPQEVLDSLKPETEPILKMSYEEIEKLSDQLSFHKCILDLIRKWTKYELKKMQLCVLLEYMIRFHGLPIKKVRSKCPLGGCPDVTNKFLLMSYSKLVLVETGKPIVQVTKNEKDKLLLLIIVLYAYLSDYEFPVVSFMVDVKVGRDKLKKLSKMLDMKILFIHNEHYAKSSKPFVLENL